MERYVRAILVLAFVEFFVLSTVAQTPLLGFSRAYSNRPNPEMPAESGAVIVPRPTPTVTPTPKPTPKKAKSMLNPLDLETSEPEKPKDTEPTSLPNKPAANEKAQLEETITRLKAYLATRQSLTITTSDPVVDFKVAREAAANLRLRVNRMREGLYLPDPAPDAPMTERLTAFQQRWGDLVRPIIEGTPPSSPLSAERWAKHSRSFSRTTCDERVVPALAPPGGMPLLGWAWTCLSDSFFHEFAQIEVDVNRRRLAITDPLERTMTDAEESINLAAENQRSPTLFLRAVTRLLEWLHKVDLESTALRIKELEFQRNAGSGTPSFRWLLQTSSNVRRPVRLLATGTKVNARLDDAAMDLSVEQSPLPRLAQELHAAHHRLEMLKLKTDNGAAREAAEADRRRVLFAMATTAR